MAKGTAFVVEDPHDAEGVYSSDEIMESDEEEEEDASGLHGEVARPAGSISAPIQLPPWKNQSEGHPTRTDDVPGMQSRRQTEIVMLMGQVSMTRSPRTNTDIV